MYSCGYFGIWTAAKIVKCIAPGDGVLGEWRKNRTAPEDFFRPVSYRNDISLIGMQKPSKAKEDFERFLDLNFEIKNLTPRLQNNNLLNFKNTTISLTFAAERH